MGGPMDADADDEYPRLAAERALLADVARRQVPVIGVCLGSQLLAVGLGAELRHGSSPEFGLGSVDPADGSAGMSSLAKAFVEAGVLHWHSDAHGLPAGAQLLASTPATPVQAFVLGRAVGMQFHIEIRPEDLVSAAPHLPPELKIDEDELQAAQRGWAEARAVLLDLIGC